MSTKESAAANLAAAFLAGAWSVRSMARRGAEAWGKRERWLTLLARRLVQAVAAPPIDLEVSALAAAIAKDHAFQQAWDRRDLLAQGLPHRIFWAHEVMLPAPGAPGAWSVPAITSAGALAVWLGLKPTGLDWFAGQCRRAREAPLGPLHHYTYRWLTSRRGKTRLLEVPKARLKAIQRRLLHEVLDHIPPHDAAHGYRRGRSVVTYVAPHVHRPVVLHFDLRSFFPSIRAARVHALFRAAGYPRGVARLLTGLCTNAVPAEVLNSKPSRDQQSREHCDRAFLSRHLPQGAPTSPALANLCAYHLDCRLEGLSRAVGANYTRYADDLVFSGDERLAGCLRRFHIHVCRIALEEGFEVNTRKSHFMRQGICQQVAGVVLNAHPNIRRVHYDRLKAILTNCVRHGPREQNREGHRDFRSYLAGRIAYVGMINPARGRRLGQMFERIRWEDETDGSHT